MRFLLLRPVTIDSGHVIIVVAVVNSTENIRTYDSITIIMLFFLFQVRRSTISIGAVLGSKYL